MRIAMTYDQFAALADPTRRQVFELVRTHNYTVGELAIGLKITQPAVSQHLRVLRSANLVVDRREGARRYLDLSSLQPECRNENANCLLTANRIAARRERTS